MRGRFLFLFLFASLFSVGQVPGYMGKRFSVGYSNYFMLSAVGPTANAESQDPAIGVNSTHCLNLEYIVKNRSSFCVSVQSSKTGLNSRDISIGAYDPNSGGYSSYSYTYSPKPYKPMQIQSINLGLGLKFFHSGCIAPVGKYKKLELLLMFNHLTYNKSAFSYYYYNSSFQGYVYGSYGSGDYLINNFAITYTLGRSRVLFDKLVLDGGIRFGLSPVAAFNYLNETGFLFDAGTFSSGNVSAEARFRNDVNYRVFRYQTFNFHIGLSFLAF